ncbi:LysR family transcriptional regulator [Halobacteriovorax sp. DPLXC-1]|uniref:LysR family transcriptional regulator n=1 Tax=Halobacteriovorax sp. DPLXC-1 TaxID=3110771 RepID=UPI002FF36808
MIWITIEQIKCLQALDEAGSFTKAATALAKAKSAVIYSINNLEEQVGFPLVDRTSYRPQITNKGRDFLNEAAKLTAQYDHLIEKTKQISSNVETRVSISVSGIYEQEKLYPIIKKAMSLYPSTEIILEKEILSGEKMLMEGRVDLAIFEDLSRTKNFEFKPVGEVDMYLVIAKDHPFLDLPKKEQSFASLVQYPQIIQRSTIPDDTIKLGVMDEALKWRVTDTPSKKEIILNGFGWGRLPSTMIKDELKKGRLVHLKSLEKKSLVKFCLGHKKGHQLGEVARFIWDSF